jgi:large subunit ribosomal protein L1
MKKRSKRYKAIENLVEENKLYNLKEAVSIIKKMSNTKFNSSVDLHFYLNVDPKKSEQMVRGTVILPHGTGKKVRIAVFCKGEQEKIARETGVEYVGANDLIDKVAAGFFDFDYAVAMPDMMRDLARLGKILGPRGLMPSPKTGTVTNDIKKAIEDLRKGKIEFKVDKQSGIHVSVGKSAFEEDKIYDNAYRVLEAINEARPSTVKGKFIKTCFISLTMSPAVKLMV